MRVGTLPAPNAMRSAKTGPSLDVISRNAARPPLQKSRLKPARLLFDFRVKRTRPSEGTRHGAVGSLKNTGTPRAVPTAPLRISSADRTCRQTAAVMNPQDRAGAWGEA